MLCHKAGMPRTRLCGIERRLIKPADRELERLFAALGNLIAVQREVDELERQLGWPGASERQEGSGGRG